MELGQLLLGQIPEALYFAIFMIFVKQLKDDTPEAKQVIRKYLRRINQMR